MISVGDGNWGSDGPFDWKKDVSRKSMSAIEMSSRDEMSMHGCCAPCVAIVEGKCELEWLSSENLTTNHLLQRGLGSDRLAGK